MASTVRIDEVGIGVIADLAAHRDDRPIVGCGNRPVGGVLVGRIGVVADVGVVGADKIVLLLPLLQDRDQGVVHTALAVTSPAPGPPHRP